MALFVDAPISFKCPCALSTLLPHPHSTKKHTVHSFIPSHPSDHIAHRTLHTPTTRVHTYTSYKHNVDTTLHDSRSAQHPALQRLGISLELHCRTRLGPHLALQFQSYINKINIMSQMDHTHSLNPCTLAYLFPPSFLPSITATQAGMSTRPRSCARRS